MTRSTAFILPVSMAFLLLASIACASTTITSEPQAQEPIAIPIAVLTDTPVFKPASPTPEPPPEANSPLPTNTFLLPTNTSTAPPLTDAVVVIAALNVRTGPGTVYDRIDAVRQGDPLVVVGQAYNCGWLNIVTPQGTKGWVSGGVEYVQLNLTCTNVPQSEIPPTPLLPSNTPEATEAPIIQQPLIIIMDGDLQMLVYNPESYAAGRNNTDDIAQILADLPLDIRKETTSLQWAREDRIQELNPNLVIIHTSAFYAQNTDQNQILQKMDSFFQTVAETQAQFLIYSRGTQFENESIARANYESRYPFLQGRIHTLYVRRHWELDNVDQILRSKVASILGLN